MSEPAGAAPSTGGSATARTLQELAPALWAALSPLGKSLELPANFLPQQTADARGTAFNATIGQITDGRGAAVPLPAMAAALAGLAPADRSRAFLYSPVEGIHELRQLWRERQRRGQPANRPSGLPIVTAGPALAVSVAADLFLDAGKAAVVLEPDGGPYGEVVTLRTGARLVPLPGPYGLAGALAALPEGEPAFAVLAPEATPAPRTEEWTDLRDALAREAARRPLVVVVVDRREGLDGGTSGSLFWDLTGLHPSLIPMKVDDPPAFDGSGLGFLTLPYDPGTPPAEILESKAKILLRATVGSPPAATQAILARALRSGPSWLGLPREATGSAAGAPPKERSGAS